MVDAPGSRRPQRQISGRGKGVAVVVGRLHPGPAGVQGETQSDVQAAGRMTFHTNGIKGLRSAGATGMVVSLPRLNDGL